MSQSKRRRETKNVFSHCFISPFLFFSTKLRFSGITEELLRDVTITLPQVQQRLLQMLSSNTIIVGHSLENDLKALKLLHSRVIDTALLFPHAQVGKEMKERNKEREKESNSFLSMFISVRVRILRML
jgi:hypothetical protein